MRSFRDKGKFVVGVWYIVIVHEFGFEEYWLFKYYGEEGDVVIHEGFAYTFEIDKNGNHHKYSAYGRSSWGAFCNKLSIIKIKSISEVLAFKYIKEYEEHKEN